LLVSAAASGAADEYLEKRLPQGSQNYTGLVFDLLCALPGFLSDLYVKAFYR